MIKHTFTFFCIILLYSCSNNQSEKSDKLTDTSLEKNSKKETAFSDQFIDGMPINHYLKNPDFPAIVKAYYFKELDIKENKITDSLMSILITPNKELTPFFFKSFMNICEKADTNLSTYLGKKCILLLEENTHYCINKLKKGYPDYFTGLVANEIYQDDNWEEEINNLFLRLHLNLEDDAPELRKELDLFIVGVKNDIEHMN